MADKPCILFIYLGKSSFVKEDLRILSEFAEIKEFEFSVDKNASKIILSVAILIAFIRQFFWLLKNNKEADLIYCWFADYHAFLPVWAARIWNLPSLTVLGGFDCIRQPSMNYGVYTSRWRKPMATYVIRHTSFLLPVDESLVKTDTIAKHWPEAHPNGLTANIPSFNTPYQAVPTGYDPSFWVLGPTDRENSVCTVSISGDIRTAKRKGIDLVIKTAKQMPDTSFTIVGLAENVKEHFVKTLEPSPNINFISVVPRQELNEVYGQSSVYLQLSRAEGLPNVLCEAMMCGCIPVGSPVFGIPHGIGETGFIAEKPLPYTIARLIQKAFEEAPVLRTKAREHIINTFSLNKRKETLKSILSEFDVLE